MNDHDWDNVEKTIRKILIENASTLAVQHDMTRKEFIKYVASMDYAELQDFYLHKT